MQTNRFFSTARRWALRFALIVLLLALGAPMPAPTASAAIAPPLLQFTAGGHVVGFAPTQVILAAFDHALRVEFVGTAGVTPVAAGADVPLSSDGLTMERAQPLSSVTYPDLWRGVSVEYRASEGSILKSTYMVAPGADAAQIRLRYNAPVELQSDGSLRFSFGRGVMIESAPIAWQEIDGVRVTVPVAFRALETAHANLQSAISNQQSEVGFRLGAYDPRYPLTIDPNYVWHTFYGSFAEGYGIAVDGSNNVYITGSSETTWQGDNNANPIHAYSGNSDIVVLKLNSAGAYQWHTFYGSNLWDYGRAIAVDGSNNVYITGSSRLPWQGDGGANPLHAHSGYEDIVVIKLNSAGTYQWHTFYGAEGTEEQGRGIAVDGNSNVYIAGYSGNTWQVGLVGPLHAHSGYDDIVVLKLNSNGVYQWHTFYGSTAYDYGSAIAVEGTGNHLYVVGHSNATWQREGVQPDPLHAYSGQFDVVTLKLTNGGACLWHTFYGSFSSDDYGFGIAVDGSGSNVYLAGYSLDTWQGEGASPNPLHTHSGGYDIFALKLNNAGAYQWHTFYGSSSSDDYGFGIAVDGSGSNVYLAGYSYGAWQGDNGVNPLHAYNDAYPYKSSDIVALKLTSAGAYKWHTFYGSASSGDDCGRSIAVDGSGSNVYLAGSSDDTWQGDGGVNPLHAPNGFRSIVALKLLGTPTQYLYLPLVLKGN